MTAAPDPQALAEVVGGVEAARVRLREVPVGELMGILGEVGRRLLDPADPFHQQALQRLPRDSGLTPQAAREVLTQAAGGWTAGSLRTLVESQFSPPGILDGFVPVMGSGGGGRVRAVGDALAFHVASGTVPGVGATSLLRSLLVKTPVLLKPGRGDRVLSEVTLQILREADSGVGSAAAVVYWPGGDEAKEGYILSRAQRVVVYGGDDTVEALRRRIPSGIPLVAYSHRMSAGAVGREALANAETARRVARDVARSVWWYDQRGCVSPHLVWVEKGGAVTPEEWFGMLSEAMASQPPATPGRDPGLASRIQQERGLAELRAAGGSDVRMTGGPGLEWTLLWESDPRMGPSPLGGTLRVKPLEGLDELPGLLAPYRRHLQSMALEVADSRREVLALELAEAGVSRITTFRRQAWPAPWWFHDGGDPLRDLVRLISLEE